MSRPILLAFLLIILIITSQFEWRQQPLVVDTGVYANKHQLFNHQEQVKEKIILSQERHIQKLNELVQSLRELLLNCRGNNETSNANIPLAERVIEVERPQIIED